MNLNLNVFEKKENLFNGMQTLFEDLNVPVNSIDENPASPKEILQKSFNDKNEAYRLMEDVFLFGLVDDAAFKGKESETIESIAKDGKNYAGLLIFGVTLHSRENNLLPTRSQLAEITRAFNREFHYTPVVVVFRYEHFIAIANSERTLYKQSWREGEKAGKISLLRDIDIINPHRGHKDILDKLQIPTSGINAVNSFEKLYAYWQEVFSVSILNKKFYKELSDWYFWALHEVDFPIAAATKDDEKIKEHNAKNLIRMLTRLLFVWFIKEKKLIPEELFDEKYIKENLIKVFEPNKQENCDYKKAEGNQYYRAILQNLFFATLNQTVGDRKFRTSKANMNVTNLMRYEKYFKNPQAFVTLMEEVVPFMNGGLFECLDRPDPLLKGKQGGDVIIYEDEFSDRDKNFLCVPDYIFFGTNEHADLSKELDDKKQKNVPVNGLIHILKSYKFTVTENTPIEEDVALDPELLGKVFENLLASYNPETKTTARKQTGSFYTPREIVNYMVDESLIAYLKNAVNNWKMDEKTIDDTLHQLVSFDLQNPFEQNKKLSREIMSALDQCKILDPACGSGAFPMGILQKMVHILQKLDPENEAWKEIQEQKIQEETSDKLKDIDIAFDTKRNDPDYARKLYLIENCIYGVDIQPIATQISKLRCFISLIVDQKSNKDKKDNYGIRPLPNLETKFVAANTLIGIEKPDGRIKDIELEKLEEELKKVRHSLFRAQKPAEKPKLRADDKNLREKMAEMLADGGWGNESAKQLAGWDPYNQNASSPFFDPKWMFGVSGGFDVVIGNPPYISAIALSKEFRKALNDSNNYTTLFQKWDIYIAFVEKSIRLSKHGITCMIIPYPVTNQTYAKKLRDFIVNENSLLETTNLSGNKIFEEATVTNCILFVKNNISDNHSIRLSKLINSKISVTDYISKPNLVTNEKTSLWNLSKNKYLSFKGDKFKKLGDYCFISKGMVLNSDEKKAKGLFIKKDLLSNTETEINNRKYIEAKYIEKYQIEKILFLEWGTKRVPSLVSRPTFPELYERPKLLVSKIGKIKATFDENNICCDQTIRILVLWHDLQKVKNKSIDNSVKRFQTNSRATLEKNSLEVNLKFLLALVNSKTADYLLDQIRGIGNIDINPEYLKHIPIPKITSKQQQPFISLVDKILTAKATNPKADTTALEAQIDNMVYRLYELTYDEVKIIDPDFALSKAEYAAIKLD